MSAATALGDDVGGRRIGRAVAAALATVVAIAAVLATIALWPASGAPAGPVRAVGFTLPAVTPGRVGVTLAAVPGRPVVLNFFAAWCDPCHAELPRLAALQRAEAARLDVVGVDVQDNRDLANQLLHGAGVGFATGYDPDHSVSDRWGVDGLPITVFIAPDGAVVNYHRGELSSAQLAATTAHLLARSAVGGGVGR